MKQLSWGIFLVGTVCLSLSSPPTSYAASLKRCEAELRGEAQFFLRLARFHEQNQPHLTAKIVWTALSAHPLRNPFPQDSQYASVFNLAFRHLKDSTKDDVKMFRQMVIGAMTMDESKELAEMMANEKNRQETP